MSQPFRLGNHTFLPPGAPAPADRVFQRPRRPIIGAIPPSHLKHLAKTFDPKGPADALVGGEFCGHNEPTFSVFDIQLDGVSDLEICILGAAEDDDPGEQFLARPFASKGEWTVLFDSRWSHGAELPKAAVALPAEDGAPSPGPDGAVVPMRVAIGFEYPVACISENDVSWVAVAIQPKDSPETFICYGAGTA